MEKRNDFIEQGSDGHAALLNLKKATKDDKFRVEDWTFADITVIDPRGNAREDYIQERLKQTVRELRTKPEVPANALPMWTPTQNPL